MKHLFPPTKELQHFEDEAEAEYQRRYKAFAPKDAVLDIKGTIQPSVSTPLSKETSTASPENNVFGTAELQMKQTTTNEAKPLLSANNSKAEEPVITISSNPTTIDDDDDLEALLSIQPLSAKPKEVSNNAKVDDLDDLLGPASNSKESSNNKPAALSGDLDDWIDNL